MGKTTRTLAAIGWIAWVLLFFPMTEWGMRFLFGYSSPLEFRDARPAWYIWIAVWLLAALISGLGASSLRACVRILVSEFLSKTCDPEYRASDLFLYLPLPIIAVGVMFFGATEYSQWTPLKTLTSIFVGCAGVACYELLRLREKSSRNETSTAM